MEYTDRDVDVPCVEDQVNAEASVLEERTEERADSVGNDLKVSEGEEVFEEAVGAQDGLQEEEVKLVSGVSVPGPDTDAVEAVDPSSGVFHEKASVGDEVENFEEAIGTPAKIEKLEEIVEEVDVEEKVEGLLGGESIGGALVVADGVDEGGTHEKVPVKEDDGLMNNGEDAVEEIAELHVDEEMRNDANESAPTLGGVLEKLDNVTEDEFENGNVSVEGLLDTDQKRTSREEVLYATDQREELVDADVATEGKLTIDRGLEVAPAANHPDNLDEGSATLATENEVHLNVEPEVVTASFDSIYRDTGREVKKSSSGIDTGCENDLKKEVKDATNGKESFQEGNSEQDPTSIDKSSSTSDKSATCESGILTTSDKLKSEKDEQIMAGTIEINKEDVTSHTQHPVEKVQENHHNHTFAEKLVKKDSDSGDDGTKVIRENGIRAAEEVASSGRSMNHASVPARPAGLGRAAPLLEPAPRVSQQPRVNGAVSHSQAQHIEEPANGESDDHDETREKLQMIRVKFLRLAHRLGQTPHNVVVAQVLYRLGLAEQIRGRNGGRVGAFSFDRASAMAEQLEASGQEPLDFSCTIMVLGKTGVGKSATINSIFDEVKFSTDAFDTGTKRVQDVVGTVQGIKVRIIDTPGLLSSLTDQRQNEKALHSIKRFIKKTPPDIVLYLDRLDMQSRDLGDMPLLRTITEIFGPSIWFNAIVVLTHAASAPPDGPNGTASSYDMFVTQRSHVVQQAIRQAAGDMRLMNPVSLVENHSACRTNRAGQRVLPNGQVWKPHLLLLSFASKILAEANALLKLQDSPPGKPFASRSRAPPLPFLLSTLLQPRPQPKLPEEQYGDDDGMDDDLDESSDSDDESEYDELPPFKRLTNAQVSKLTRAQKKAYFDELEYREKLFMKKQLKEERRRRRMMKKMAAAAKDQPSEYVENAEEESGGAASVPVPMPDLALPASFDSDNPTHRYRYLDNSTQWLVRPVLDTHGWDHDVGYEGINLERLFVVKDKIPISFSGQVSKDKKDANVQMEVASSLKHGEGKSTSLGLDMQTVGKDLAYTLRSETRFSNFRKNKATAGLSFTLLNDALTAGLKVEDKLIVNKWLRFVMTGGAITSRGDVAYGGSLDATLRDKDYPLGRSLFTLGLSVMDWHGDLAVGGNIQSQLPIGRSTNLIARANLNNRGAGQVSVRVNSSEQLQIVLLGLIPLFKKLLDFPLQWQLGQ
ncbi:AIG1-type G domain-containing protein [Psidium guajava]|nr:AIG1-type G domain-containing protein [Psidium guajava]